MKHPRLSGQDGLSVVEVMVAMAVLLVGLLGTFVLVDGANSQTSTNLAREQGNVLARDVLERARQVPYDQLADADSLTRFQQALLDTGDAPTAVDTTSFTVDRRGTRYAVQVTTCRVDDPADGSWTIDSTYCNWQPGQGSTEDPADDAVLPVGTTIQLGGLVVPVQASGTVLQAVCAAAGPGDALNGILGNATAIAGLVGAGAGVEVCPSGDDGDTVARDDDPDDYTRTTVNVRWTQEGRQRAVSHTAVVPNPAA